MEFPPAGRENAKKFLEYFLSRRKPPVTVKDLPVPPNFPTLTLAEAEAECMDVVRTLLAKSSCPGLLNYNITAAVAKRVVSSSLEHCLLPPGEGEGEQEPHPQTLDGPQFVLMVTQMLFTVCQEWSTDLPRLVCSRERPEISIHALKNTRRKMEDRHSVCMDLNTLYGFEDVGEDQTFFGVYDGHVGVDAATYCEVHLHHNIARHPSFLSDPVLAIKEGIKLTDDRFCASGRKSGSTAVVALLRGSKLYVGWVGDSQAMLFRQGQPVSLMEPHKPDREDEQKRIEDAGGIVMYIGAWRVNGNLSVARAIGDAKEKKLIIGEAEVTTIDLDGTEDYLVVACDGVWDVVNGEELVQCTSKHFCNGGSKGDFAKAVANFAIAEGSTDNLTAIVVFFKSFKPPQAVDSTPDSTTPDAPNGTTPNTPNSTPPDGTSPDASSDTPNPTP